MSKCGVKSCKSRVRRTKQGVERVSFYKIPLKSAFRQKWIDIISKENGEPFIATEAKRICVKHFEAKYFSISTRKKRLLPYAVPSIFDNGHSTVVCSDIKANQELQEVKIKAEDYNCYRDFTSEEITTTTSTTHPNINLQSSFGLNFYKTRNVLIQVDFQDILRERLRANEKPHYLSQEKRHLIQQLDLLLDDRNKGDTEAGFIIELVKTHQAKLK